MSMSNNPLNPMSNYGSVGGPLRLLGLREGGGQSAPQQMPTPPPTASMPVPMPSMSPMTRAAPTMPAARLPQRPNMQQVIQNLRLLHGQPGL